MTRTMILLASIGMLGGLAACSDGNGGPDGDAGTDDTGVSDDGAEPEADAVEDAEPDAEDVPADAEPDEGGGTGPCTSDDACGGEQACIGGGCVDPVADPAAYAAEAAGRPSSFFWRFQYPSLLPVREDCCFDYDDNPDNGPDDALGNLLPVMTMMLGIDSAEFQALADADVESGVNVLVTDWRGLPVAGDAIADGPARLSVFPAVFDPVEDWTTRVAGDGTYELDPAGFGTHGALTQFNDGEIVSGALHAGPSTFPLRLPDVAGGLGLFFFFGDYTLRDARIEADVALEANGVHTVDETRGDEGAEYVVGGGRLGGVIPAADIAAGLNGFFSSSCACAGVAGDVVSMAETVDGLVVECIDGSYDDPVTICCTAPGVPAGCVDGTPGVDCCAEGGACANLPMSCDYMEILGEILDVDTNDNGVADAMSVGLRFSWTGASIDGLAD